MFGQRLADALGDAALHLADGQQRVDQGAVVIDGGVAVQRDLAGFGIDLDFGDVAAVGEGDDVEQVPDIGVERCVAGDGQQIDGSLAGRETAVGEYHLIGLRLQQPGGDRLGLFDHLLRGLEQRGAAHVHGAGAAVAVAFGDFRGIGLDVAELLQRQTQQVGGDLRIGGFVALGRCFACRPAW